MYRHVQFSTIFFINYKRFTKEDLKVLLKRFDSDVSDPQSKFDFFTPEEYKILFEKSI